VSNDIHAVAEDYWKKLVKEGMDFRPVEHHDGKLAPLEKFTEDEALEFLATIATPAEVKAVIHGVPQVILFRNKTPEYFCGFKPRSLEPVWSYDIKYAKQIDYDKAHIWAATLERISEPVLAIWHGVKYL
jgi:hypothetical protein